VIRAYAVVFVLALNGVAAASGLDDFDARGVSLKRVMYRGRSAIEMVETGTSATGTDMLAVLKGGDFHDGTIDGWLSGQPAPQAPEGARGFVGIAFRVGKKVDHYEAIYIRPTNGRADDQLRRNHSIQYISQPEYPWERLRNESPGMYESYADMTPGTWIHFRIVVKGTQARLFLGPADQPSLIVTDLKHGDESGAIALWIGPGTVAHFCGLEVSP
jgi:hypothetical protein